MPRKQLRPSIKLRRLYAPLIEACRNKVLTAPSQTSGTEGGKLITICIKWPVRKARKSSRQAWKNVPDMPEDFPTGVVVERTDEAITIRHNVFSLLKWFKAKAFTTYDASDLFAQRLPIMMMLCKMELGLDRLVDFEQQNTSFIEDVLDE